MHALKQLIKKENRNAASPNNPEELDIIKRALEIDRFNTILQKRPKAKGKNEFQKLALTLTKPIMLKLENVRFKLSS